MERSQAAVKELSRNLSVSQDENRQYHFISNHNLQKPLRKMQIFISQLVSAADANDLAKTKDLAQKVATSAQRFSSMVKELSDYSALNEINPAFEAIDLAGTLNVVRSQLSAKLQAVGTSLIVGPMPAVRAIGSQTEQVFYHLSHYMVSALDGSSPATVQLSYRQLLLPPSTFTELKADFVEIKMITSGVHFEKAHDNRMFELFSQNTLADGEPAGNDLAYCRKIVRQHGGDITLSLEDEGFSFLIVLPAAKKNQSFQ